MIHISFLPEHLFSIGGLQITNTLLISWVVVVLLSIFAFYTSKNIKLKPKALSLQNVAEAVIEAFFNLVQGIMEEKELTRKVFPLVATIFFFIIFSNWIGLLPGLGTVGLVEVGEEGEVLLPFLRSPSADLNTTIALAVIAVLSIQILGIATLGLAKYSKRFFNFSSPIAFFVGVLELVGEVAKIISFSFRLFGNVFAGEVLLTVMLFLVPLIGPIPFFLLEIFVGFMQALVFSLLTIVFIKIALHEEGAESH